MNKALVMLLRIIYILTCVIASLFYIRADFGKIITELCGYIWLVLCILLCIAYVVSTKLELLFEIIITLLQVPIIYNWLFWAGGHYYIGEYQGTIGMTGTMVHIAITIIGYILIKYSFRMRDT